MFLMVERAIRFFKNLVSAAGHCVVEEPDTLPFLLGLLAIYGLGVLIFIGYDLFLDPSATNVAARLDLLSIGPDKWKILS